MIILKMFWLLPESLSGVPGAFSPLLFRAWWESVSSRALGHRVGWRGWGLLCPCEAQGLPLNLLPSVSY